MMMNESIYRLGEYRITEYEDGLLRWETHFNFGVQRIGKCFTYGDILIIGHWSHEEIGYLIMEFFEQLRKLPAWSKTRYYCFAFELLDIITGQNLTNDSLEQLLSSVNINSAGLKSFINMNPGSFRLGRYQITISDTGELLWQTHGEFNRVVGGRCVIESDVLFIDPQKYYEREQGKQDFRNELHQLPQWDKTIAWCRGLVLRTCQHPQQKEEPNATPKHQDTTEDRSFDEKPSAPYRNSYEETSKGLSQLGFKWLKTFWHRIHTRKVWLKYLIPLILVGLLLGLVMILHSVEKKLHWPHWFKEHHHKHKD